MTYLSIIGVIIFAFIYSLVFVIAFYLIFCMKLGLHTTSMTTKKILVNQAEWKKSLAMTLTIGFSLGSPLGVRASA